MPSDAARVCDRSSDAFLDEHADKTRGSLSCFDRVIFRGYLPPFSGREITPFLKRHGVRPDGLKAFLIGQAERLKQHARQLAQRQGRPFLDSAERVRKAEKARKIAERSEITEGLVYVLSTLELCWTFALRWDDDSYVRSTRRKCLLPYFYFVDRELGLIAVKLQTWFPMQLQVYVNGHEWLARKPTRSGMPYLKHDNVFLRGEDLRRELVVYSVAGNSGLDAGRGRGVPLRRFATTFLPYHLPASDDSPIRSASRRMER